MTGFSPQEIEHLRSDTPGVSNAAHFNSAGASLMPLPVVDAIKEYLDLEAEVGGYEATELKCAALENVYDQIAAALHTQAKNIAITASATDSYAIALSSIPFSPGDKVIIAENEYTSNQIQLLSLAKRLELDLIFTPARSGTADLSGLEALISAHRPKLVASVHLGMCGGSFANIEAIGGICKQHGVLYLVDGCQSFGQAVINVESANCDFFSASARKFMRGPRGVGVLYVSQRVLDERLEPLFLDMRGATLLTPKRYEPSDSATRFENFEFPYALVHGFGAAVRYAVDLGLERIEAHLIDLARRVRMRIAELEAWQILGHESDRSAIISLCARGKNGPEIFRELSAAGVKTTLIPRGQIPLYEDLGDLDWLLRVSPHYYNSAEDVDRLITALGACAGS